MKVSASSLIVPLILFLAFPGVVRAQDDLRSVQEELRRRLVASGRLAIGRLSWERSAERTRSVLAAAANRR